MTDRIQQAWLHSKRGGVLLSQDFADKFKNVARRGMRSLSLARRAESKKSDADTRMESIVGMLSLDEDGSVALASYLGELANTAHQAQRANMLSQPDVSYGMGLEDAWRQIIALIEQRDKLQG
jgi:hypothetical protein